MLYLGVSMNKTKLEQKKQCVIDAGNKLVAHALITRTWGNVSSRIDESSFLITPSGLPYKYLTPEQIVEINLHDLSYSGDVKPSSETAMHAGIYKAKPEVNFIIHTHQLAATVLSIFPEFVDLNKHDMAEKLPEFAGGLIPISKYAPSGTKELADNVCEKAVRLGNMGGVLMANHGAIFFAENKDDCFEIALRIEKVCLEIIDRISGGRLPFDESKSSIKIEYRNKPHSNLADCIFNANREYEVLAFSNKPHILGISLLPNFKFKLPIFVDDFAQIAGVRCTFMGDDYIFGKNNMVMNKRGGCIAVANSEYDVEAICEITEKNALICLFSEHVTESNPLPISAAIATREDYLSGYSKLATAKN
ncbi:MAG: hypothetical protein CR988_02205 [Treponema sp.]|nr:MAG: hypothetical protein CR988_02205 [Treponema sp.]